MQAIISNIKRLAVHDGDGIRTTIFFKGCPLECIWCHNPECLSIQPQVCFYEHKCISCGECIKYCEHDAHQMSSGIHTFDKTKCVSCRRCTENCLGKAMVFYGEKYTVDELLSIILEDKIFYENSGGGVTLSGGECLLQADFCAELLKKCKEKYINTAIDTCGFVPKSAFDTVIPYTDTFLYDFKHISSIKHKELTGRGNELILSNLLYLSDCGKEIEIRIPYIPSLNSYAIDKMGDFLTKIKTIKKVKLLPYHNLATSKYKSLGLDYLGKDIPIPTKNELFNAYNILKAKGLPIEKIAEI